MNWDAIAAVGEVGGAVAVVATLLYLSRQIRESSKVSRAEAVRSRGERMLDSWFRVAENERLFSAIQAAYFEGKPFDDLSDDDQLAMRMMLRGLTARWESEYFENRHGVLDDAVWERRLATIAAMVRQPAYHQCWVEIRPALTAEFVESVEQLIARQEQRG